MSNAAVWPSGRPGKSPGHSPACLSALGRMSSLLTGFSSERLSALAKGIAGVCLRPLRARERLLRRMESRSLEPEARAGAGSVRQASARRLAARRTRVALLAGHPGEDALCLSCPDATWALSPVALLEDDTEQGNREHQACGHRGRSTCKENLCGPCKGQSWPKDHHSHHTIQGTSKPGGWEIPGLLLSVSSKTRVKSAELSALPRC